MNQKRIGLYQLLALGALNIAIVIYFWSQVSGPQLSQGLGPILVSIGRLCGLAAVILVLGQLVMISRVRWLERKVGFDTVTRYHRANGETVFYLIFVHPILLSVGYALQVKTGPIAEFLSLLKWQYVDLALIAWLIFMVLIPFAAIRALRIRLSYEQWYYTHLAMYAAIALVFFHQITNGADFTSGTPITIHPFFTNVSLFKLYWYAIYIIAFGTIAVYRFLPVVLKYQKHRFVVQKVEQITPSAVSVYVTGKNMKDFRYKPGQFNKWIFLAKGYYTQSHPFTISVEPGHDYIRLSAKGVGDFTKTLGQLPVGTKVLVDGPYGVFTPELTPNKKVLLIAGGSGITPLRAMVPHMLTEKGDVVLVYGNQTVAETMLAGELAALAADKRFVWHNVLSNDPTAKGEHGYVTAELIAKLVPDVTTRDLFLCGPPIMVQKLVPGLLTLGISEEHIHYERFSL